MNTELSQLIAVINNEIGEVLNTILLPHFETMQREKDNMRVIETILKQMPEFKRLEKENAELKQLIRLSNHEYTTPIKVEKLNSDESSKPVINMIKLERK